MLLVAGRAKQLVMSSRGEAFLHGSTRGSLLGFESSSSILDVVGGPSSSTTCSKELRRIGKIQMVWEESVSLWAHEESSEYQRGRVKLQWSSFLCIWVIFSEFYLQFL
uniref:Uncharacterized protein n=1 Tax=Davidia involucrata TaxID=16924 RepID=A0A5B7C2X8_DAVIN